MLLALALAAISPQPAPPPVRKARATVRIERAVRADAATWNAHPDARKREVTVTEKDGRTNRVRLIEFE